ncbi:hypothetical protein TRVL_09467 [Trypanosoma vivax]|nr:hypothetical protein TRVL_09467 [Trypanosoma vivax]
MEQRPSDNAAPMRRDQLTIRNALADRHAGAAATPHAHTKHRPTQAGRSYGQQRPNGCTCTQRQGRRRQDDNVSGTANWHRQRSHARRGRRMAHALRSLPGPKA